MSLIPNILRLLLLLLTPLWLSLAAEGLGMRWSLPPFLSGWLHMDKAVDPALVPPPGWREGAYLAANPDVAAAVRNGVLPSGYAHYVRSGRAENRPGGFKTPPAQTPASPMQAPAATATAANTAALPIAPGGGAAEPAPPTQAPVPIPVPAPAPVAPEAAKPAPAAIPQATIPQATIPQTIIQVSRIRTANSDEAIRIVLDLDQPPRFDPPARQPDGTLAVTLPATLWKAAATGRLPPTALTYRTEESGGGSRLIVKGDDPVALKAIFALPPETDRGHRLVIDVVQIDKGQTDQGQPGKAKTPEKPARTRP